MGRLGTVSRGAGGRGSGSGSLRSLEQDKEREPPNSIKDPRVSWKG